MDIKQELALWGPQIRKAILFNKPPKGKEPKFLPTESFAVYQQLGSHLYDVERTEDIDDDAILVHYCDKNFPTYLPENHFRIYGFIIPLDEDGYRSLDLLKNEKHLYSILNVVPSVERVLETSASGGSIDYLYDVYASQYAAVPIEKVSDSGVCGMNSYETYGFSGEWIYSDGLLSIPDMSLWNMPCTLTPTFDGDDTETAVTAMIGGPLNIKKIILLRKFRHETKMQYDCTMKFPYYTGLDMLIGGEFSCAVDRIEEFFPAEYVPTLKFACEARDLCPSDVIVIDQEQPQYRNGSFKRDTVVLFHIGM